MLLEVRPSEGGDDSVAFAADLRNALLSFIRSHGCSAQPLENRARTLVTRTDCAHLDQFTGTHRIQRIPPNDRRGRRHTSTVTVALVDLAQVSVELAPDDLEFAFYIGSGNGGQNRNKLATAVRVRHLPTGTVVTCEEERSQWQNKQRVISLLQRRLQTAQQQVQASKTNQSRREQISSGERSAKVFTWNQERGEVKDHSTGRHWSMASALRGKLG